MEKKKDDLEAIRKFTGDDNLQFIGPNDTFGFKCQQCGKCCMNREDIILNPFDIYNGAKYLGIEPIDFLKQYCFTNLGAHSKMPMVLLATTDNGFCPLLKFDVKDGGKFKCTIHPAKPGACSNHPIGVTFVTNMETGEHNMQYIKTSQCSNSVSDEQQLVKDWVKPYTDNIDEINIAHDIQRLVSQHFDSRKFWYILSMLLKVSQETNHKEHAEMINIAITKYLSTSVGIGYTEYDINKPFIEQAQKNIEELNEFYKDTKQLFESLIKIYENITGANFEEEFKAYNEKDN